MLTLLGFWASPSSGVIGGSGCDFFSKNIRPLRARWVRGESCCPQKKRSWGGTGGPLSITVMAPLRQPGRGKAVEACPEPPHQHPAAQGEAWSLLTTPQAGLSSRSTLMASQRAHKQPPASQGIPCAPAWSGGTEHLSLPALIPPRTGRVGKASSAPMHGSQSPSLSPWSIPGEAASSKPPCGTCPCPCKPHPAARKHRPCIPAPKQQLFPLTHYFFCTPSGSRCNLPPY